MSNDNRLEIYLIWRKNVKKRICSIFIPLLLFLGCTSPSPPPTHTYFVSVPYHKQYRGDLCQATSIWMISEYYADIAGIGWWNNSFIASDQLNTEININNLLLGYHGLIIKTWSSTGYATDSYSDFMYYHLDTTTTNSALLHTNTNAADSMAFQKSHFKYGGGPMIVGSYLSYYGTTHALVMYGVKINSNDDSVNTIYYHDPINGQALESTPDEWRIKCMLPSTDGIYSSYFLSTDFSNL